MFVAAFGGCTETERKRGVGMTIQHEGVCTMVTMWFMGWGISFHTMAETVRGDDNDFRLYVMLDKRGAGEQQSIDYLCQAVRPWCS